MFYKAKAVKPLPEYSLSVRFSTGEIRKYNVKSLFEKWEQFKALAVIQDLFEQIKADTGGYGVSRNDDMDLSCNELYENGVKV